MQNEMNTNEEQYMNQQVYYFDPSELIDHPNNSDYFDDMSGSKWDGFIESVRRTGIKVPVVITQDKIIVSGHQRKRAAEQLNIKVPCVINEYYDHCGISKENWILYDLISTNTDQRGIIGGSELKAVKRVETIRNIFGIGKNGKRSKCDNVSITENGNNCCDNESVTSCDNESLPQSTPQTIQEASEKAGVNYNSYRQLKHLLAVVPEIQEAVENGEISVSIAARIVGRLSKEDQYALLEEIPDFKDWNKQLLEQEISKIRMESKKQSESFDIERADYARKLEKQTKRAEKAEMDIIEMKRNGDPEVSREINRLKSDVQREKSKAETLQTELNKTKQQMSALKSAADKNIGYAQGLEELIDQLKNENSSLKLQLNNPVVNDENQEYNVNTLIAEIEMFKVNLNTNMLETHNFLPVQKALEIGEMLRQVCDDIRKYSITKENGSFVAA